MTGDPVSKVNSFFCSVNFCCRGNMIFPVVCVFYFYYINRFVGIAFLGRFGFRNFLSFPLFRFAGFRDISFFLQFCNIDTRAGYLCLGCQFGA